LRSFAPSFFSSADAATTTATATAITRKTLITSARYGTSVSGHKPRVNDEAVAVSEVFIAGHRESLVARSTCWHAAVSFRRQTARNYATSAGHLACDTRSRVHCLCPLYCSVFNTVIMYVFGWLNRRSLWS